MKAKYHIGDTVEFFYEDSSHTVRGVVCAINTEYSEPHYTITDGKGTRYSGHGESMTRLIRRADDEIQELLAVLRGWSNSHGTTEWAMNQLGLNERHFLTRARTLLEKHDPPVGLETPPPRKPRRCLEDNPRLSDR